MSNAAIFRLKSPIADFDAFRTGDQALLDPLSETERNQLAKSYQGARGDAGLTALVIGGNGFVGAHLLGELLGNPRYRRIIAIVRGSEKQSCRDKVLETALNYELALPLERIEFVNSSFMAPKFGLTDESYASLVDSVDVVFHCAGSTCYVSPYESFRDSWVLTLIEIMNFCATGRPKALHYLGSVISHLFQSVDDFKRGSHWWYSGYARMKWVNGCLVRQATELGLKASVYEAHYICGSTTVAKDPGIHYSLWRMIRAYRKFGLVGDCGDRNGVFTHIAPVDMVVEAMVLNSVCARQEVVVRPRLPDGILMQKLAELLGAKLIPWDEYHARILATRKQSLIRMNTIDWPEVIDKTNIEAIFPEGFDLQKYPDAASLMKRYLEVLGFDCPRSLAKTAISETSFEKQVS